jgi:hypothetical protein
MYESVMRDWPRFTKEQAIIRAIKNDSVLRLCILMHPMCFFLSQSVFWALVAIMLAAIANLELVRLSVACSALIFFSYWLGIGSLSIVRLTFDGIIQSQYDPRIHTPLGMAVFWESKECCKFIIRNTTSLIVNNFGWTHLFLAVKSGNITMVRFLLKEMKTCADLDNHVPENGKTPLHAAINRGNYPLVKCLIDEGKVDVNSVSLVGSPLACLDFGIRVVFLHS